MCILLSWLFKKQSNKTTSKSQEDVDDLEFDEIMDIMDEE